MDSRTAFYRPISSLILSGTALLCILTPLSAWSQSSNTRVRKGVPIKEPPPTIEPGLEVAVKWKWQPKANEAASWGLPLAPLNSDSALTPTPLPGAPLIAKAEPVAIPTPPPEPIDYLIQKGDSLGKIASRHGMSVSQLKQANDLTSDVIRVGKTLRIPSLDQIKAMTPPPATPKADGNPVVPEVVRKPAPKITLTPAARAASHITLTQAYLDRQNFSAGPIDGQFGPMYQATLSAYEVAYPGVLSFLNGEKPKVLVEMGEAFVSYTLKHEDFQFIAPGPDVVPLEQMTAGTFLPYRSAWEFIAERFHAEEAFIRKINPNVKKPNEPGATFLVPNVFPFEIENALSEPLQSAPDAAAPIKAAIVQGTRLRIHKGDQIIAYLPVSTARPGLRGSGTWMILDAVLRPSMSTTGELANPPKDPALAALQAVPPQTLPPGPNNPVGPLWIHLAKPKGTEPPQPLPYGLHGTSIPTYMTRQESIGGFRMANWDIARVARLLPVGTPLTWE